jgi:hypothetical protein
MLSRQPKGIIMTRHIIALTEAGRRLQEFLRIDRQNGMHPAVRALHVRVPGKAEQDARLAQYLRIARGREV